MRKLFSAGAKETFRYQYVRIMKQVLFGRPAYRVRSVLPLSDEKPSGWVVDGVWLANPPVNVSVDEYNSIIDNDMFTLTRPISAFRFHKQAGMWVDRKVEVNREYVRNGSPFGRLGRTNRVIHGLLPEEIFSREHWTESDKLKRDRWIKRNAIAVTTNSVSMRMGDGEYAGSWCWSISVEKQDKERKYAKANPRADEGGVEARRTNIDNDKGEEALEVRRLQVLQASLGIQQGNQQDDPERTLEQMQDVQKREGSLGEGQGQAGGAVDRSQGEDEEGEPGGILLENEGGGSCPLGDNDWQAEETDFVPEVREEVDGY